MKYAIFNVDGTIAQACNDHTVAELPEGAMELTDEQFANWPAYRLVDGVITFSPPAQAPLTKAQRIAHILATQGEGKDRTTLQMAIQLSEVIATVQAPAYGMTTAQAIAYAYSKNATYKRSKDAEAAIRVVELEP